MRTSDERRKVLHQRMRNMEQKRSLRAERLRFAAVLRMVIIPYQKSVEKPMHIRREVLMDSDPTMQHTCMAVY